MGITGTRRWLAELPLDGPFRPAKSKSTDQSDQEGTP